MWTLMQACAAPVPAASEAAAAVTKAMRNRLVISERRKR
jgi:hypothetical protein